MYQPSRGDPQMSRGDPRLPFHLILSPHRITCSERVRAIPEHLTRSAVCSSILEHTTRLIVIGRSVDVGTNLLGPDHIRRSLNWSHNLVCYTQKLLLKTISMPHSYHRVITRAPVSSLTSES